MLSCQRNSASGKQNGLQGYTTEACMVEGRKGQVKRLTCKSRRKQVGDLGVSKWNRRFALGQG